MAAVLRSSRNLMRCAKLITNRQLLTTVCNNQRRCFHPTLVIAYPGVLKDGEDPISLSNKDWQKRLPPEQYYVCREKGTELPFSGQYVHNNEKGIYSCACCGAPLFSSETKYDSKSGWPSFYQALASDEKKDDEGNILRCHDNAHGMSRLEVVCKQCDAHLGHVFSDGPKPTGERFCINSASLEFVREETEKPES